MRDTAADEVRGSTDTTRCVAVGVAAVLAVVGSFVGSGALVGTPVSEAADGALAADATLVAPAGPAFSIWTLIYIGFVAYAIWQALPSNRADPRQRRVGWWIVAAMLLNAAWILSIQADLVWGSVVVILVLLAVLVAVFRVLVTTDARSLPESVVLDGTMFLYLGWVCVAVVANIAAALAADGAESLGLGATAWAIIVLAAVGAVSILLAVVGRGRAAVAAAIVWGLAWIAYGRSGEQSLTSTPVAVTAVIVAVVVVSVTVGAAVRARTR